LRIFHKAYIEGYGEVYLCPAHQRALVRNRKLRVVLNDGTREIHLDPKAIVE
jgi:hypothetical protein